MEKNYVIGLIEDERSRQILCKGWTPEHDDAHTDGELARAAGAYAIGDQELLDASGERIAEILWPFEDHKFRPKENSLRNLVKAGALIVAECERILRILERGVPGIILAQEEWISRALARLAERQGDVIADLSEKERTNYIGWAEALYWNEVEECDLAESSQYSLDPEGAADEDLSCA